MIKIGSQGTQFYLKLMSYVTSSFLDKELAPLERIYRIWFANFGFRLWRFWMCCDNIYSLGINFITLNAYLCCEINAHGLISLMLKLKDRPELFQPWNFSSQPCEAFFRAARSFTSTQSTQVNFTLKDFIVSRRKKVEATLRLAAHGSRDGIVYPRERRAFDTAERSCSSHRMPSEEEIEETVLRAQQHVELELKLIGIIFYYSFVFSIILV